MTSQKNEPKTHIGFDINPTKIGQLIVLTLVGILIVAGGLLLKERVLDPATDRVTLEVTEGVASVKTTISDRTLSEESAVELAKKALLEKRPNDRIVEVEIRTTPLGMESIYDQMARSGNYPEDIGFPPDPERYPQSYFIRIVSAPDEESLIGSLHLVIREKGTGHWMIFSDI